MYSNPQAIIDFWFDEESKRRLAAQSNYLDAQIRALFMETWQAASDGELWEWRNTQQGRLAEIIVLDQFSRHLFRGKPEAYAQDKMALILAQEAVRQSAFPRMEIEQRYALLLPFMHSENRVIHTHAVNLFERYTTPEAVALEMKHKTVIDHFGRFPSRNAILGRKNTEQETAFLAQSAANA